MKTIIKMPKRIKRILDNRFPNCRVLRVVQEVNNVDTVYWYIIVQNVSGQLFAAWNSERLFHESDFLLFYSYEDAHEYLNREICIGNNIPVR